MGDDEAVSKRVSIRSLSTGDRVKHAYNADGSLVTGDINITSKIDVQRLKSLGVKYVVLDEEGTPEEVDPQSETQETLAETITEEILDEQLRKEPNLVKKTEKNYDKLVGHIKTIFTKFHRGEVNLDRLYELFPYLEQFIKFVDESPASVSILTQIEEYNDFTFNHSVNVSILGILYGHYRDMDEDTILDLGFGGLLHDIGKTEISHSIINKDGTLTDSEFEEIQKHPAKGARLLAEDGFKNLYVRMSREHHERPDGTGYPQGTRDIHPYARILSVLDVYEAMTAPRSYKPPEVPLRAYQVLREEFLDFDSTRNIVRDLIQCLGVFPVGSLVRLTDGTLAVVQKNNREDLMRPTVSIISDEEGRLLEEPYIVDLYHVYHQKKYSHQHFYDEDTVIETMILPESRTHLKEQIHEVYSHYDINTQY